MTYQQTSKRSKGNKRKALFITLLFHAFILSGFLYADGTFSESKSKTEKVASTKTKKHKRPKLSSSISTNYLKAKKALGR